MNMVSKSKNLDHVTKLLQHSENCMHHNKYEMNDDLHEREYLRMGLTCHKTKQRLQIQTHIQMANELCIVFVVRKW